MFHSLIATAMPQGPARLLDRVAHDLGKPALVVLHDISFA